MEGAIAVYRQAGDSSVRRGNMTVQLAHLLARHSRGDKAIEVMRAFADAGGAEDWILHVLCTLYTNQGRSHAVFTARVRSSAPRRGRNCNAA